MAWIWCGADVYHASRSQACWCSLARDEALPAKRLLERASPWKRQPAANVELNSCLWLQKLALAAHREAVSRAQQPS